MRGDEGGRITIQMQNLVDPELSFTDKQSLSETSTTRILDAVLITHPVTGVRISCNFKYLYPAMTCDPSIVSGVREGLAISKHTRSYGTAHTMDTSLEPGI